ncbi:MAG: rod shape-determining protein RodA [Actinobacteria bacterium]|nr:MAG: rod shape-determining protein RodA [Actinomycetota bacterium]
MALEGSLGRVERIGRQRVAGARLSEKAPIRHLDATLVLLSLMLAGFGALMIYSATYARLQDNSSPPGYYLERQLVFAAVGFIGMMVLALFSYRRLKAWAWLAYTVAVAMLVAVLTPLGTTVAGAQRWIAIGIFQIQLMADRKGAPSTLDVIKGLVLVGVPAVFIYLQPDLGTLLVLLAVLGGMLLVSGARMRLLIVMVMLGAVAFWGILHVGLLKEYQVKRLTSFLDPASDPGRTGYNLQQSKIAIGSGQVTGRGLFNGTQTNLRFVPEQHTDFIFTVVGEELGFAGAALFVVIFAMFIWRGVRIAMMSKDHFGTLLAAGIVSMFAFQGFVNMGMTMGISPITGIPLPFVSYGGSSLIASFLATGILLNIHMRRL